jgi:hypothetical protein
VIELEELDEKGAYPEDLASGLPGLLKDRTDWSDCGDGRDSGSGHEGSFESRLRNDHDGGFASQ